MTSAKDRVRKARETQEVKGTGEGIIVKCPDCRARLRINPHAKRTVGKCPRCACEMDFSEVIRGGRVIYIVGEPRPGQVFGEYRIEDLLGRGGMGAVFRALHPFTGQRVALKVLRRTYSDIPKFRGRFEREIEVLRKLDHPNIVKTLGRGEADGVHYFTMNLVKGASLREIMKQGRLNTKERLRVVGEVCSALQHAHDHGVIHRDLKPQNVLIDDGLHAQVLDFGIARLTKNSLLNLTRTGQIIGTSRYMAPEQQRDTKHVDGRADVYSLGVMTYELLTGRLPIGNFVPLSRLAPKLPPGVDAVIDKALEVRPEDRYARPERFWSDMERALRGASLSWRRKARVMAVVAAAAAVVVGAWLLWSRSKEGQRPGGRQEAPAPTPAGAGAAATR